MAKRVCPCCCEPCKDRCYVVPWVELCAGGSYWWTMSRDVRRSYNHLRPRRPFHGPRVPQAKDLTDRDVLDAMERAKGPTGVSTRWNIEGQLPGWPGKVVLAKLASMVRRGVITGCPCGCSGPFEVKS